MQALGNAVWARAWTAFPCSNLHQHTAAGGQPAPRLAQQPSDQIQASQAGEQCRPRFHADRIRQLLPFRVSNIGGIAQYQIKRA